MTSRSYLLLNALVLISLYSVFESKKIVVDTALAPSCNPLPDGIVACGNLTLALNSFISGDLVVIDSDENLTWEIPLVQNDYVIYGKQGGMPSITGFKNPTGNTLSSFTFGNIHFIIGGRINVKTNLNGHLRFFNCKFNYETGDFMFQVSNDVEVTVVDSILHVNQIANFQSSTAGSFNSSGAGSFNFINNVFEEVNARVIIVLLDQPTTKYSVNFIGNNFKFMKNGGFSFMKVSNVGSNCNLNLFFKSNIFKFDNALLDTNNRPYFEVDAQSGTTVTFSMAENKFSQRQASNIQYWFEATSLRGHLHLFDRDNLWDYNNDGSPQHISINHINGAIMAKFINSQVTGFNNGVPTTPLIKIKVAEFTNCIEISNYGLDDVPTNQAGIHIDSVGEAETYLTFRDNVVPANSNGLILSGVSVVDSVGSQGAQAAILNANPNITQSQLNLSNSAATMTPSLPCLSAFDGIFADIEAPVANNDLFSGPLDGAAVFTNDEAALGSLVLVAVTPFSFGQELTIISATTTGVISIGPSLDASLPPVKDYFYYIAETTKGQRIAGKMIEDDKFVTIGTTGLIQGKPTPISISHNFPQGAAVITSLDLFEDDQYTKVQEVIQSQIALPSSPASQSITATVADVNKPHKLRIKVVHDNDEYAFFSQAFPILGFMNVVFKSTNPTSAQQNEPVDIAYEATPTAGIIASGNFTLKAIGATTVELCDQFYNPAQSCSFQLGPPFVGQILLVLSYGDDTRYTTTVVDSTFIITTDCDIVITPPIGVNKAEVIVNQGFYKFTMDLTCENAIGANAEITLGISTAPLCTIPVNQLTQSTTSAECNIQFTTGGMFNLVASFSGNNLHPPASTSLPWQAKSVTTQAILNLPKQKYVLGEQIDLQYVATYGPEVVLSSNVVGQFTLKSVSCSTVGQIQGQQLIFACSITLPFAPTKKRSSSQLATLTVSVPSTDFTAPIEATQQIEVVSLGQIALTQTTFYPEEISLTAVDSDLIGLTGCVTLFNIKKCIDNIAVPVTWSFNVQAQIIPPKQGFHNALLEIISDTNEALLISNQATVSLCFATDCSSCDEFTCLACAGAKLLSVDQTGCVASCAENEEQKAGVCTCKSNMQFNAATSICEEKCTSGCKSCVALGLDSVNCLLCDNDINYFLNGDGTKCVSSCQSFETAVLTNGVLQCKANSEAFAGPGNGILPNIQNTEEQAFEVTTISAIPEQDEIIEAAIKAVKNIKQITITNSGNKVVASQVTQTITDIEQTLAELGIEKINANSVFITEEEQNEISVEDIQEIDNDNTVAVPIPTILACNGVTCTSGVCVKNSAQCALNSIIEASNTNTAVAASQTIYVPSRPRLITIGTSDAKLTKGSASAFTVPNNLPPTAFFAATQTPKPNVNNVASGVLTLKFGVNGVLQQSATFAEPIEIILVAEVPANTNVESITVQHLSEQGQWQTDANIIDIQIIAREPLPSRMERVFVQYKTSHLTSFAVFMSGSSNGSGDSSGNTSYIIQWLSLASFCVALVLVVLVMAVYHTVLTIKDKQQQNKFKKMQKKIASSQNV